MSNIMHKETNNKFVGEKRKREITVKSKVPSAYGNTVPSYTVKVNPFVVPGRSRTSTYARWLCGRVWVMCTCPRVRACVCVHDCVCVLVRDVFVCVLCLRVNPKRLFRRKVEPLPECGGDAPLKVCACVRGCWE